MARGPEAEIVNTIRNQGDKDTADIVSDLVAIDTTLQALRFFLDTGRTTAIIDEAAGAATDIIAAPGAGVSLRVYKLLLTNYNNGGTVQPTFLDVRSATTVALRVAAKDGENVVFNFDFDSAPWRLGANEALTVVGQSSTGGANWQGIVIYDTD